MTATLRLRAILILVTLSASSTLAAADEAPTPGLAATPAVAADALPEPLTLEHALALADAPHPELQAAAAETELAQAQRDSAAAAYGFNAGLTADATVIEPADLAFDQSRNDSEASLYLSKRLYDFGHTRASIAAAEARLSGRQSRYADVRLQRSLYILERYLDVLLADLAFRVQDEAMAIAYVRLERAQDRQSLGQIADVELLESDTRYQETRSARYRAQARQRTSRVQLAAALYRPGQLSSALAEPALTQIAVELPELEVLITDVLQVNPRMQALRAEAEAAREQLQAARALTRPVITGRAEASEYQRQTGDADPWSVGVQLEVPLYSGGRSAAERAAARAGLTHSEAELARAELELRQDVQMLWEEIQVLRVSREETRTRLDYRELYLDRSRALYEMEVNSDLGDAMVVSSEARLHQAELDYRLLLNWARLNALRGRPLFAAYSEQGVGEGNKP